MLAFNVSAEFINQPVGEIKLELSLCLDLCDVCHVCTRVVCEMQTEVKASDDSNL